MHKWMKIIILYFFAACCCLSIGCSPAARSDNVLANAKKIKIGMDKENVIDILGNPKTSSNYYCEDNIPREIFYYPIPTRHSTDNSKRRPIAFVIDFGSNQVWRVSYLW